MSGSFKRISSPALISLVIVALVFGAVIGLQLLGQLQYLELRGYDLFINWHARALTKDPRIVLIRMTENDILNPELGGYPIQDAKLAELLELLAADKPSAIGLDLYRDVPEPRSGAQIQQLNVVLSKHPNIIGIWKFGDASSRGVPPSPVLKDYPERIGFNDFSVDVQIDNTVRRGLLYLDDGTNVFESFALRLALIHLQTKGIHPRAR